MKINYRSGFMRLYAVVSVFWILFAVIIIPAQMIERRKDTANKIESLAWKMNEPDQSNEIKAANKIRESAHFVGLWKEMATRVGLLVVFGPIAITGVVGWTLIASAGWVSRGFKQVVHKELVE